MVLWTEFTHLSLDTGVVADLIEGVGRDTWFDCCGGDVQHLAGESADLAHCVLAGGIEKDDFGAMEAQFSFGNARIGPVWMPD